LKSFFKHKDFLDEKARYYESPNFIKDDPISIIHNFQNKYDIEISGFITATISWGRRTSIINCAKKIIELMDNSPYDFIINHQKKDLERFNSFVYRTFNSNDIKFFIKSLKNIYKIHNGLEYLFSKNEKNLSLFDNMSDFKKIFFEIKHEARTTKHVSDPKMGSASKRLNMFLRWMVRSPKNGVDMGIWKKIKPSDLSCPLDVHSGNIARKLNLISRKNNDLKALKELDKNLRKLDKNDPVKYDFALFGLGIYEGF
tara:strand:- start:1013 stop:1780 length:768 start_codon:yes stop_codon:yes gene_type:complete